MKFKLLLSLAIKKNYSYLSELIQKKLNFKIDNDRMHYICKFLLSDNNMMLSSEINNKLNIKKDIFLKLLKSNKINNCILTRCLITFYFIYFFIITDIIEKISNLNELFRKNNTSNYSYNFDFYINLLDNINLKNIDFEKFLFLISNNNFSVLELFKNQMNC